MLEVRWKAHARLRILVELISMAFEPLRQRLCRGLSDESTVIRPVAVKDRPDDHLVAGSGDEGRVLILFL